MRFIVDGMKRREMKLKIKTALLALFKRIRARIRLKAAAGILALNAYAAAAAVVPGFGGHFERQVFIIHIHERANIILRLEFKARTAVYAAYKNTVLLKLFVPFKPYIARPAALEPQPVHKARRLRRRFGGERYIRKAGVLFCFNANAVLHRALIAQDARKAPVFV